MGIQDEHGHDVSEGTDWAHGPTSSKSGHLLSGRSDLAFPGHLKNSVFGELA